MKKSIFTKAYKYTQTEKTNQLEDYLTELFVGALQLDPFFRKKFIEELGSEEKEDFKISTQNSYKKYGRPDIEIQNGNDEVILIECKVESTENIYSIEKENAEGQVEIKTIKQLNKYISILNGKDEQTKKLVYLTKYAENKKEKIKYNGFSEKKWWDVLKLICDDCLPFTKELKKFIHENNIAMDSKFTETDLIAFSNIKHTIWKMNEVLDLTKKYYVKRIGGITNIREVTLRWGGYVDRWKSANTTIDYGFMKWAEEDSFLGLRYYVENEFYANNKVLIDTVFVGWQYGVHENYTYIEKRKYFVELIFPKEKQLINMTTFFKENIDFLSAMKEKHSEIF